MPRSLLPHLLAVVVLAGCAPQFGVPDGAILSCQENAHCPSGRICRNQRCVDPSDEPPALAAPVEVSPRLGRVGTAFTVTVRATEPLKGPPVVLLGTQPPVALGCEPLTQVGAFRCLYTATGAEANGLGGSLPLDVTLADLGGNIAQFLDAARLRLDFKPPSALLASVSYAPDGQNPLSSVEVAKAGTTVTVDAISDEELSVAPADLPTLTATNGVSTLTFVATARPGGASFSVVVPPGASSSPQVYVPTLAWTDLAGNRNTHALAGVTLSRPLRVKTTRPALAVRQDQVTFLRSPWGRSTEELLGTFRVPPGPYLALAPADPLSSDVSLPANTFTLDEGRVMRLRLWADAAGKSFLLDGEREPSGAWSRTRIPVLDLPAIFVTGVDEAGNESVAVKIANAEWVATTGSPQTLLNPHRLRAVARSHRWREPSPSELLGENTAAVEAPDGAGLVVRSEIAWELRPSSALPPRRVNAASAYDAARGRWVIFGGGVGGASLSNHSDTWEFDGKSWLNVTPPGGSPPPRRGHGLAYDSARGRVVLFGGETEPTTQLDDLWEWDGSRWTQLPKGGAQWPAARAGHAMAYDPSRRRVVVFGGRQGRCCDAATTYLSDLSEWDGTQWSTRVAAGAPGPRAGSGMVYDPRRERIVIVGGAPFSNPPTTLEVYEWNGAAWSSSTSVTPGPRSEMGLAADGSSVLMFGGVQGSLKNRELWSWDGLAWTARTSSTRSPPASSGMVMTHFPPTGEVLVWVGESGINPVVAWSGSAWYPSTASTGEAPAARSRAPIAYDPARARTVMFGGLVNAAASDETWEWDGIGWVRLLPTTSPPARSNHLLVYEPVSSRLLMFCGANGATLHTDLWAWNGNNWTSLAQTNPPPARDFTGAVYDSQRARVVLFGGFAGGVPRNDLWELDPATMTWANRTPFTLPSNWPSARSYFALGYDPSRRVTVLHGGQDATTSVDDTWEWNGTSWRLANTGQPGSGRRGHSMTYDSARGRLLRFGGEEKRVSNALMQDLHEWDGSAWVRVSRPSTSTTEQGFTPAGRKEFGLAYDPRRKRTMLFGGTDATLSILGGLHELDADPDRRPSVQLQASVRGSGITVDRILGMRVRAHAAASFLELASTGVNLLGWSIGGPSLAGWVPLATNVSGLIFPSPLPSFGTDFDPTLPAPATTGFMWVAGPAEVAAEVARGYLEQRTQAITFQLEPAGGSGLGTGSASLPAHLGVDSIEVRVRYAP